MRTLAALSLSALVFLAPLVAMASPTYPATIVTDLMITCQPAVPQCTVCHATLAGGGKPTTGFGIAMVGKGLVPNDPASLSAALTALQADPTNSAYIKALQACTDPNAGATPVGYGIYCSTSGSDGSGAFLVVMAVALAIAIARKRGR
jgi:hypothetical protein